MIWTNLNLHNPSLIILPHNFQLFRSSGFYRRFCLTLAFSLKCYLTYPNGFSNNYFYRFFSIYSRVKLTTGIASLYPRGSWFEQTKINTILGCYNTFYYFWPKGFWENVSLFFVFFLVLSQYGPTLPQGFMLSTDLSLHNLRVFPRKI